MGRKLVISGALRSRNPAPPTSSLRCEWVSGPRHAKRSLVPARGKATIHVSPDDDGTAGLRSRVVMVTPDAREIATATMPWGGRSEKQDLLQLHRHRRAPGAGRKPLGFPKVPAGS